MNTVFSLLCICGVPLLVITRQYRVLFVLAMISVMANQFFIQIFGGSRMLLASYISLIVFPFILPSFFKELKRKKFSVVRALFIEFTLLILLAIYFNFVSPLEGSTSTISFNTGVTGRSILGTIRIFSDFALIVFIVFLVKNKIIDLIFFGRTIFLIAAIHIPITLFDFVFGYPFEKIFIQDVYLTSRPHGFCHEPKGLGRLTFGALLFFLAFFLSKQKLKNVSKFALPLLSFGVIISLSASALIGGLLTVVLLLLLMTELRNIGKTAFVLSILGISIYAVFQLEVFQEITLKKINFALGFITRDKRPDEPALFTFLENFDRSAAYFFIKNPSYLWLGTGPNLVSIPASNYMSDYYSSFIERADGLPQTVIYYVSRSGLVGISIFVGIFYKLRKRILKVNHKPLLYLLYGIYIFTFINNQVWFMIYLGLIYGVAYYQLEENNKLVNAI